MKIAVLIGTYNNRDHVDDTIESVRNQSESDWMALIVDNGSDDGTPDRIRELIAGDQRFHFFEKPNEGPSASRNFAVRRLKELELECAYLHFLDGDDTLASEFIAKMVGYLDRHPEVGLLGCQYNKIDAQGRFVETQLRTRFGPSEYGFPRAFRSQDFETPFEVFFSATGQGPFAVFRADVFAATSGYEEDFWSHEDTDIFCQMALLAPVHYLPLHLYNKREHAHNLTSKSCEAGYLRFREKWDLLVSEHAEVNARIENSLRYYYRFHRPFRLLKKSGAAAHEFVRDGSFRSFRRVVKRFFMGVFELIYPHPLRRIGKIRQRSQVD